MIHVRTDLISVLLIYMNDISNSSNLFKFMMFADDTNL